ncbi:MAG: outer membrane lipoprotein chaperone LolA [Neptuniibacter sp.]
MDFKQTVSKLLAATLLTLFCSAAIAEQGTDKLHELLQSHTSFSANFEQVTLAENGREAQKTSGRVFLSKPNLYRWETETPYPQEIVSDGKYVWIYDPDLEQVTQRSADTQESSAPALILNGQIEELSKKFSIRLLSDTGADQIFELIPLTEQHNFSNIRLAFTAGTISELMLEDSLGQRTSIVFSEQQINPELDEEIFFFRVPADADLLVDIEG